MSLEGLTPVADVGVGAWIAPRLCGFGGKVCCIVPTGFAAYARVLHPAVDDQGDPVTWTEVCQRTGSTPHPRMQWRSISRGWAGGDDPREGRLPAPELAALLDVLTGFTADGSDCYHAVWAGWGWLRLSPGGASVLYAERRWPWRRHRAMPAWYADGRWTRRRMWRSRRARPGLAPRPAMPEEAQPWLRHPGRDYLLFHGPLHAAANIGDELGGRFDLQGPNLLWPADRSWCVGTEIDFDSTLVAGSVEHIEAVLRAPGLEAWPVAVDDDLTVKGDQLSP